jgi:uncharacterized repeat protein (TIGR02543 family)
LTYNITSQAFTLAPPQKSNDIFTGWTGSNGDDPQMTVTISKGSTGERTYYANFLYSGREDVVPQETPDNDRIWVYKNELHIITSKPGSIARIYTLDGVLHKVYPLVSAGETNIKLHPGVYIVTLNNNPGKKIMVADN